ncbi:MAG: DUF2330 domain-containing protein [Pseudomonadota bacterium]
MRILAVLIAFWLVSAQSALAFCGFFVAKADGALFNEASKVVFVRDGRRSVITMSNDYRGPAKDFAMVIPTPKVLKRNQIRTVKPETIDHVDAYTAPRLVEYFDEDPCNPKPVIMMEMAATGIATKRASSPPKKRGPAAFGVTVKAEYAVGAYDIVILDAKQSDGLTAYLTQEGYKLPKGGEPVLQSYIENGMKFFVARVNLERFEAGGKTDLMPLQISFKSAKFMLPLQLGKLNADESQDALMFMLTRKGRVEAKNYANKRMPSDVQIPLFVRHVFPEFYRKIFSRAAARNTVITEYAWDMAWCDPCAADPLSVAELNELGVDWVREGANAGQDVFVTRLHIQYDKREFAKDLEFTVTDDRQNFQGRYIMNVPFTGALQCEAGAKYLERTQARLRREAVELQTMTGWEAREIERRIKLTVPASHY